MALSCPEGQSCYSAWPFVQVIIGCSDPRRESKIQALWEPAGEEWPVMARLRKEVQFAAIRFELSSDGRASVVISFDGCFPDERDGKRRANPAQKEKG